MRRHQQDLKAVVVWALVLLGLVAMQNRAHADHVQVIRFSVSTPPGHALTNLAARFVEQFNAQSDGGLKVRLYHSAQLYRDEDIPLALHNGNVEMALPLIAYLRNFSPKIAALADSVPLMRRANQFYQIENTPVGDDISRDLNKKFEVSILGAWIKTSAMRRFVVGGKPTGKIGFLRGCHADTQDALGTRVVRYSGPDLAARLANREFSEFIGMPEDVVAQGLWRLGVSEMHYISGTRPVHLPLIRTATWTHLTAMQRKLMRDAWRVSAQAFAASTAKREQTMFRQLFETDIRIVDRNLPELQH